MACPGHLKCQEMEQLRGGAPYQLQSGCSRCLWARLVPQSPRGCPCLHVRNWKQIDSGLRKTSLRAWQDCHSCNIRCSMLTEIDTPVRHLAIAALLAVHKAFLPGEQLEGTCLSLHVLRSM